ncbi:terminase large subunit domain-containing protein [Ruegeria sp. 6PALISEP08]|uniref:terminase large subunit domain-containing protein n=1 Tax=Ruegeria sp. 6PALISEP08 TaxID=1225660 RepID=UPI00067EB6F2|nr:terminase family protein [Ruegeria sp. 6PALISEP08]
MEDYASPSLWAAKALGLELDDWQAEIMEAEANRICVVASRQSGKSTVTAARAAYTARTNPGFRIVVVSPTFRQSSALRTKVVGCLQRAEVHHGQSREEIRLLNGSSIIALPGDDPDKVRGATADLVIIDECAFVKEDVAAAILPMLTSTGGDLIAVSTPNGPQGLFHELATDKDAHVINVPAERIARFDEDTLSDLRTRLGPARASQELDCAFVVANRSVFDANALAAMFGDGVATAPDLGEIKLAAAKEDSDISAQQESARRRKEHSELSGLRRPHTDMWGVF